MTIMVNIGAAFGVFLLSVFILSTNYKTVWPAPNFVTHSASYDFIFQDIALDALDNNVIDIEYAYKSLPIATMSSKLINTSKDSTHHEELLSHQAVLEKQANLHHLLHIPPWALVPDRISSTSGSVSDLFKIFDALSAKQEHTLSVLSELIEIIPTDTMIKSHMEELSASQKYWMKNMSRELFNASQTIFSYQLINFAEEIQTWVQNSPYSNDFLRLIFERTRGIPLLYNPSIPQQIQNIHSAYQQLCNDIIESSDDEQLTMSVTQCEVFLDSLLTWIPDKPATLTTMWPSYYDVDVDALKRIKGINSPYTLVIKQNRKPSGELLHYVSAKGDERIQVEWFNEKYHLRATNLAFVRRIRIQIKRISSILKRSVTLSSEEEEDDDLAAFWASLESEEEEGTKPSDRHIEQLPDLFKEYVKSYANELEKGQFDDIMNMDLAQNDNKENQDIFIHGLPSIAVFNDGGIKRAWNFIIGIIDNDLLSKTKANDAFIEAMDVKRLQSKYHKIVKDIELEITGVWPYAVGGYLRSITPEVSTYKYPPYADAKKTYGKQRCVLLLDVLDKLYTNNMRQIGMQRLKENQRDAKLITLKSSIEYISMQLNIEHKYFHNKDNEHNQHSLKQGLFINLAAFVGCANAANAYGCVLSGYMYHVIEGFNRENPFSLVFISMLEREGLVQWQKKGDNNKDVMDVMNDGQDIHILSDDNTWKQWKKKYFNDNVDAEFFETLKQELLENKNSIKLYKRAMRHIAKYSVLRRPGEDTYTLQ